MSARLTPRSACTIGSATVRHHMPMPPTVLKVTLATSRRQAYAESMPRILCNQPTRSTTRDALGVDVERIERVARRHEQAIAMAAAEAEVGAALRQVDVADRLARRIEYAHAVEVGRAHAPAAPQIAVDIDPETVGRAARSGVDQHGALVEPSAVGRDVVGQDGAVWLGARGHDIELLLVGREGKPVGAGDIVGHHHELAGRGVEAIDGGLVLAV